MLIMLPLLSHRSWFYLSSAEAIPLDICVTMASDTSDASQPEPNSLRSARTFVIAARTNRNLSLVSALVPVVGIVAGYLQFSHPLAFLLNLLGASFLMRWVLRSVEALSTSTGRLPAELLKGTLGHTIELMVRRHCKCFLSGTRTDYRRTDWSPRSRPRAPS